MRRWPTWRAWAVLIALVLATALAVTPAADAAVGDLTQKLGTAGCVSEDAVGPCQDGTALVQPYDVATSADGKSVYMVGVTRATGGGGYVPGGVAIFRRNTTSGALTFTGCISAYDTGGACATGREIESAYAVAVSPDGKSVYVTNGQNAVAVFTRNTTTGNLTQAAGPAGCVSDDGSGGCTNGRALSGAFPVAVSPDSKTVYVGSSFSGAVAVFSRNTSSGAVTQKLGTAGCVSESGAEGCATGRAVDHPTGMAVSADRKSVYVTSAHTVSASGEMAVFDRNTGSGVLTQKAGAAGCVNDDGASGCRDAREIYSPSSVATSPDGRTVYVTSDISGDVAVFSRSTSTGALLQKAGAAGCLNSSGASGCAGGAHIGDYVADVAVSPDGKSVYVSSAPTGGPGVLASLSRNPTTGVLTQKPGVAGCYSEDGSGGACRNGRALDDPRGIAISPNGESLYSASRLSEAITIFNRVPAP